MEDKLFTADEVADYLRIDRNTVYIWCRNGILPAVKIGKEWRISESNLSAFLTRTQEASAQPIPLQEMFDDNLEESEHLFIIAPHRDDVWRIEAEFFKLAVARGYPLLKGCWWQHPDDVRHEYVRAGLPVEELEARGKLVVYNFWDAYRQGGAQAVIDLWYSRTEAGYFWGSGSYLTGEWDTQLQELVDFENELHHALHQARCMAICPCVPTLDTREGMKTLFKLTLHHSGTLLLVDDDQVALLRPPALPLQ